MAGIEYDPRTGEPKQGLPLAARMTVLIVAAAFAAWLFYDISQKRHEAAFDTRRIAYDTVRDVRRMQNRFNRANRRYATLEELKDTGWFDHEIIDGEAHCDYDIKVRLKLSMDRQDYSLEVEHRRGIYHSSANDLNEYNDYQADQAAKRRR